jgi:magnesium chelatase family protein
MLRLMCVTAPAPSRRSARRSNSYTHGCPCGHYGDPTWACSCPEAAVSRYRKRLSGPLLDRIDLHVEVPRVDYDKLAGDTLAEPPSAVRARVEAARARQWARFAGARLAANAEMGVKEVRQWCRLDGAGEALLRAAVQQLGLSARAYHRVLVEVRVIARPAPAACTPCLERPRPVASGYGIRRAIDSASW